MSAMTALCAAALAGAHLVAILAGFVAPYSPQQQHREHPWAPPARWSLQGFGLVAVQSNADGTDSSHALLWWHRSPDGWKLFGTEERGKVFLMGTDGLGRDQFSRLVHGARLSLFTGLIAALLAAVSGTCLGMLAGYFGAGVDTAIMRTADLFLALPWMFLLMAARAFFPLSASGVTVSLAMIAILGVVGWARPARLVRGITLEARQREYVCSSRGFGGGHLHVMRRHLLPEVSPVIATYLSLAAPQYVLAETTLAFLGLGAGGDATSWGDLMTAMARLDVIENYWWMLLPVVAFALVFACYNTLAGAFSRL